jgi:hypothetical protein
MNQGIHFDESYAPVASIASIHILICMAAVQGKHDFVIDVRNVFQNNIQFDASKRTYNMMPPFFSDNIGLHWPDHPELPVLVADLRQYAIHKFRYMQGEKDAGCKWYQLLAGSLVNMGMHRSVADHTVFTWRPRYQCSCLPVPPMTDCAFVVIAHSLLQSRLTSKISLILLYKKATPSGF